MKKEYVYVEMEIIRFDAEDIITESDPKPVEEIGDKN